MALNGQACVTGMVVVSVILQVTRVVVGQTADTITLGNEAKIRGRAVNTSFGSAIEFLGIPYALPPVKERRFIQAEAHAQNWSTVFAASDYGAACLQRSEPWSKWNITQPASFSENCLFLNVHVPGETVDLESKKAVMVGIHGGDFQWGASQMYPGSNLAVLADVIVVTFNFRLNVFGFLTTGSDSLRGNLGLYDQRLAMEWVRNNILSFGGDDQRITVFGHGAGGSSVSLHAVSPGSRFLFHRAISMSGFQPVDPFPEVSDLTDQAVDYLTSISCPSNDGEKMLECLQGAQASILMTYAEEADLKLMPIVDGNFLRDDPGVLYAADKYHDIEYMAGVVADDGTAMLNDISESGLNESEIHSAIAALEWKESLFQLDMRSLVMDQYFPDTDDSLTNLRVMIDLFNDKFFLAPTVKGLDAVSRGNPVYFYHFAQLGPDSLTDAPVTMGPVHMEELPYLFGGWFDEVTATDDVKAAGRAMIHAFASFAKTGKPECLLSNGTLPWPEYDRRQRRFVEIQFDVEPCRVSSRLRTRFTSFWNEILPALTDDTVCDDGNPSLISRSEAETILFILILVVTCLLMAIMVMCANR